jgi:hypothetical protein
MSAAEEIITARPTPGADEHKAQLQASVAKSRRALAKEIENLKAAYEALAIAPELEDAMIATALIAQAADGVKSFAALVSKDAKDVLGDVMAETTAPSFVAGRKLVSLSQKARGLLVTDETLIPGPYWQRTLDRDSLTKDLRRGWVITGATLDNGGGHYVSMREVKAAAERKAA